MGAVSTSTAPMWTPGAVGRVTASDWIAGVCGALQALSSAAPKAPAPISAARRVNDKVSFAAILAVGVVGYSRLMGEHEAGTAKAVREHREVAHAISLNANYGLPPTATSTVTIFNDRFTSTPAVCGAIVRRCRCRRAAGRRPRLLAIPPFKSARAGAPVQAPKTASLLVSRQWTYVVATSSTSWKRWRGRTPANSWALGDRRQDVRLQRMQHDVCRGDLVQGAPV